MRNLVKGRGRDLRGLKYNSGTRIAVGCAASWLVGIVVVEAELGLAAMLSIFVAVTASFVGGPCTFAFGGDAGGCLLLPREVRDRRTRMIIRISNVDEMARVHRDLEKVGQAAVGAAQQAAG